MGNNQKYHTRRFFALRDICLVAALLAIALALWLGARQLRAGPARYANVVFRGDVVKRVYLHESGRFSVDELPGVEFEARSGDIAFVRSDCPDQVCVNTGWLSTPGDFAACLPNGVMIIIPADSGQLDAITR